LKYYLRYMDDFIILHESRDELFRVKYKVKLFFELLRLRLHPKKANVFPIRLGIDFLGYRIFLNYKLIRKSTVKRFLKNVRRKIRDCDLGVISFDKLMESFVSWEAYMSYGDSYRLRGSLYLRCFKDVI